MSISSATVHNPPLVGTPKALTPSGALSDRAVSYLAKSEHHGLVRPIIGLAAALIGGCAGTIYHLAASLGNLLIGRVSLAGSHASNFAVDLFRTITLGLPAAIGYTAAPEAYATEAVAKDHPAGTELAGTLLTIFGMIIAGLGVVAAFSGEIGMLTWLCAQFAALSFIGKEDPTSQAKPATVASS